MLFTEDGVSRFLPHLVPAATGARCEGGPDIDDQVAGLRQEVDEERRQPGGKAGGVPFFAEGLDNAHVVGVAVGIRDLQQIRGDRPQIAVFPKPLRNVMARRPPRRLIERLGVAEKLLSCGLNRA